MDAGPGRSAWLGGGAVVSGSTGETRILGAAVAGEMTMGGRDLLSRVSGIPGTPGMLPGALLPSHFAAKSVPAGLVGGVLPATAGGTGRPGYSAHTAGLALASGGSSGLVATGVEVGGAALASPGVVVGGVGMGGVVDAGLMSGEPPVLSVVGWSRANGVLSWVAEDADGDARRVYVAYDKPPLAASAVIAAPDDQAELETGEHFQLFVDQSLRLFRDEGCSTPGPPALSPTRRYRLDPASGAPGLVVSGHPGHAISGATGAIGWQLVASPASGAVSLSNAAGSVSLPVRGTADCSGDGGRLAGEFVAVGRSSAQLVAQDAYGNLSSVVLATPSV